MERRNFKLESCIFSPNFWTCHLIFWPTIVNFPNIFAIAWFQIQNAINQPLAWLLGRHIEYYDCYFWLSCPYITKYTPIALFWSIKFLETDAFLNFGQPPSLIVSRHNGFWAAIFDILVTIFELWTSSPYQIYPYGMVVESETPQNSHHLELWAAMYILVAIFRLRRSSQYRIFPSSMVLESETAAILNFWITLWDLWPSSSIFWSP